MSNVGHESPAAAGATFRVHRTINASPRAAVTGTRDLSSQHENGKYVVWLPTSIGRQSRHVAAAFAYQQRTDHTVTPREMSVGNTGVTDEAATFVVQDAPARGK